MRERDLKNTLAYNNIFAYKKTKDYCKLEDRFLKKAISQLYIHEIADKKIACNKSRLYWKFSFTKYFNIITIIIA